MIARRGNSLFSAHSVSDLAEVRIKAIEADIERISPERARAMTEDDVVEQMARYRLEPLVVDFENPTQMPEAESSMTIDDYGQRLTVRAVQITIRFPFSGERILLQSHGSSWVSPSPKGIIVGDDCLDLAYIVPEHSMEQASDDLKELIERDKREIASCIQSVNTATAEFNEQWPKKARQALRKRQELLNAGRSLAESLNIPLQRRAPEEVKVLHPAPRSARLETRAATPKTSGKVRQEWTLSEDDHGYILSIIEQMILVMERSPRTFALMKEEELRDILLVILNAHFRGQATGETFNFEGKTDILIRHEGRNVFIGECKFWGGAKIFTDTIDQLLRYSSWRDTKAAVVFFNRNKNLTQVLRQIPETVAAHPAHERTLAPVSETHFRFTVKHPSDPERKIAMAVLVFDVPAGDAGGISEDALGKPR